MKLTQSDWICLVVAPQDHAANAALHWLLAHRPFECHPLSFCSHRQGKLMESMVSLPYVSIFYFLSLYVVLHNQGGPGSFLAISIRFFTEGIDSLRIGLRFRLVRFD